MTNQPTSRGGIGYQIKELRRRQHMTLEQLAAKINCSVGILTMQPGSVPEKQKIATGETVILVQSGQVAVELVDKKHELKPGESLHFENTLPHKYYNSGRATAQAIICAIPPESRFTEG